MHADPILSDAQHDDRHGQQAAEPAVAVPVPTLLVGAADDRAEVDADRRADAALARLSPAGEHAHPHGVRRSTGSPAGAVGLAGGALDSGTEERLTSRLGRGGALDASVRRRMEGAFGSSFTGVGVHTDGEADALSRRLSATAFTVGKDVFFSKGAYRPGDESGDRLIAHELAHVEQQGDGAHRMVHRAVGFEFETNVVVKQTLDEGPRADGDTSTAPLGFAPFGKAAVLKTYPEGFRMEADENTALGSTIEFVVDPPVAEGDRDKLVTIMKTIQSEVAILESTWKPGINPPAPSADSVPDRRFGDRSIRQDAWYVPVRTVTAGPQVTGGVDLAQVATMMSEIGNQGDHSQLDPQHSPDALDQTAMMTELEKLSGGPRRFVTMVRSAEPPTGIQEISPELEGLASLLVMYLRIGNMVGKPLDYAKLISSSLLVRTDFASVFNKLPKEERKVFTKHPKRFVRWILKCAELGGTGKEKVFKRGVLKSNIPSSPDFGVLDPDFDVTRETWLLGITEDFDCLSAKDNARMRNKLEGLGRLGNAWDAVGDEEGKDTDVQERNGLVMEFRNMRKAVEAREWSAIALGAFDYIVSVNQRSHDEELTTSGSTH